MDINAVVAAYGEADAHRYTYLTRDGVAYLQYTYSVPLTSYTETVEYRDGVYRRYPEVSIAERLDGEEGYQPVTDFTLAELVADITGE